MRKITAAILMIVMVLNTSLFDGEKKAEAASKYITVSAFAEVLVKELGLTADGGDKKNGYTGQLIKTGIIKEGDFTDYSTKLTRGDLLVLISRADDYLYSTSTDGALVQKVIEKRISDIKSVAVSKREDIAKGYIKGFMKGYSNGKYITNRNLKLTGKITKAGAMSCLKALKDKSLRAKISPDGQLIRTTNLPKNAKDFEYILESYPNNFYERQFEFMINDKYKSPDYKDYYAYPSEMRNKMFRNWFDEWPLSEEMDKYLYDWAELAERYLNYVFNVDYRTVDDEWIEGLGSLFTRSNLDMSEEIQKYYIGPMKTNKVVVESSIIAVEPTTFYKDDYYCIRAYIRYRITAENMNTRQNQLIYSQYPMLDNIKSGEWRDGIFDVRFGINNGSSGDGSDFSIDLMTHFIDKYNISIK